MRKVGLTFHKRVFAEKPVSNVTVLEGKQLSAMAPNLTKSQHNIIILWFLVQYSAEEKYCMVVSKLALWRRCAILSGLALAVSRSGGFESPGSRYVAWFWVVSGSSFLSQFLYFKVTGSLTAFQAATFIKFRSVLLPALTVSSKLTTQCGS